MWKWVSLLTQNTSKLIIYLRTFMLTNKKKVKTGKEKMQKPSFQQPVTITFKGWNQCGKIENKIYMRKCKSEKVKESLKMWQKVQKQTAVKSQVQTFLLYYVLVFLRPQLNVWNWNGCFSRKKNVRWILGVTGVDQRWFLDLYFGKCRTVEFFLAFFLVGE